MISDRPLDQPSNWPFQVIPVPPGLLTPGLQMASQEERLPSLRTEPLSYGARETTVFWFLESPRNLRTLVACRAGLLSLPTRRMRAPSMVHLVLHSTFLETLAGHFPGVELLVVPILHTKLWPTRQSLVMSGFLPTLGSSTLPTLGQPSTQSRTSLRRGP